MSLDTVLNIVLNVFFSIFLWLIIGLLIAGVAHLKSKTLRILNVIFWPIFLVFFLLKLLYILFEAVILED